MLLLNCDNCGKSIRKYKSQLRKYNFCSKECYLKYRKKVNIRRTGKYIECTYCGKSFYKMKCFIADKNFCNRKCYGKWKSENYIGKGNPAFGNKRPDLSLYNKTHVRKGKENPNYGKKQSEKHKEKLRQINIGNKYCVGRKVSQETRDKISKALTSPDVNNRMRAKLRAGYLNGRKPPHGKWTEYNGIKFRSTWEAKFAEFLDGQNINWVYEKEAFDLGKTTYTPDFWIYQDGELDHIVEVKGYMRPDAKLKIELFKEIYATPLNVVGQEELQNLGVL